MVTELYERIQEGLQEKQKEITEFLETAPEVEKDVCLCDDDECIETHLHVIETSLEKIEDNTLGICVICHEYVDPQLLEMDYTAAVCLDHYSDEERRRLESELELSQVVQRALLPQQLPNIKGVEVAAFSRPSEIIGGDYFDFFQFRDGTHGLVIADVSGHELEQLLQRVDDVELRLRRQVGPGLVAAPVAHPRPPARVPLLVAGLPGPVERRRRLIERIRLQRLAAHFRCLFPQWWGRR